MHEKKANMKDDGRFGVGQKEGQISFPSLGAAPVRQVVGSHLEAHALSWPGENVVKHGGSASI